MTTAGAESSLTRRASDLIGGADAMLVGAGAGMGVDSGLPDFRGNAGFWKAYPPFAKLGLRFTELADPRWFRDDPALAWGFYGHRLNLYRATAPHPGFALLLAWGARMPGGVFVYTSNVDGQFQKAGFDPDRVVEAHGSIHHMQCLARCGAGVFASHPDAVDVDPATMRARGPLPSCPSCGGLARPNILMFGNGAWDRTRALAEEQRFRRWLASVAERRLVALEFGAGTAIPTVRYVCEGLAEKYSGSLIRVNPREAEVPDGHLGLRSGALAAITAIEAAGAGPAGGSS